jgi:hypothetical protein
MKASPSVSGVATLSKQEGQPAQTSPGNIPDLCDARERIEHCLQCVATNLPVPQQVAVLLSDIHGCRDKEAARIVRTSVSSFKNLLHQGRTTLNANCSGTCVVIAKKGLAAECTRRPRLTFGTEMRVPVSARSGPGKMDGMRHSARLLKLRDRLVRETLFFDLRRADRLGAGG